MYLECTSTFVFHGLDLQLSEVSGTLSSAHHGPGSVGVRGKHDIAFICCLGTQIVVNLW